MQSKSERTHVELSSNGIEQPAMRVNLLLVLCLDHQNDLNWDQVEWVVLLGEDELGLVVNRKLGGVLRR
jgi:hypothetical protein